MHLEIDAERGITGSLSGTWDPAAGAVNLFWLWGVEQETLEVQVPRGVGAVTIVVGSREVVLTVRSREPGSSGSTSGDPRDRVVDATRGQPRGGLIFRHETGIWGRVDEGH